MPDETTSPTLTRETPTPQASVEQVRASLGDPGPDGTSQVPAEQSEVPPEPQGEPSPEEAEQPAAEEPAPQIELPEGWDAHELVAEKIKEAESAGYNKAKSHLARAHSATLAEIEETHKAEIEYHSKSAIANEMVQSIASAVQDLDLEDPTVVNNLRKVLGASGQWANVFLGNQHQEAQRNLIYRVTSNESLVKDLPEETVDEFNAFVSELGLKLRGQVAKANSSEAVSTAYTEALTAYLTERDRLRDPVIVKAALASESKKLETAARKAAGLSERADTRAGGAPPVRPAGSAARGKSIEEELADPRTPVSRLEEIRAKQR